MTLYSLPLYPLVVIILIIAHLTSPCTHFDPLVFVILIIAHLTSPEDDSVQVFGLGGA